MNANLEERARKIAKLVGSDTWPVSAKRVEEALLKFAQPLVEDKDDAEWRLNKSVEENALLTKKLQNAQFDANAFHAKLTEVEKERDSAMKALHDLTVGGSEFVNDIKACVDYVHGKQQKQHVTIVRYREEVDYLRARLEAAEKDRDAHKAAVEHLGLATASLLKRVETAEARVRELQTKLVETERLRKAAQVMQSRLDKPEIPRSWEWEELRSALKELEGQQ